MAVKRHGTWYSVRLPLLTVLTLPISLILPRLASERARPENPPKLAMAVCSSSVTSTCVFRDSASPVRKVRTNVSASPGVRIGCGAISPRTPGRNRRHTSSMHRKDFQSGFILSSSKCMQGSAPFSLWRTESCSQRAAGLMQYLIRHHSHDKTQCIVEYIICLHKPEVQYILDQFCCD